MNARELLIDSVDAEFDRDDGIRQASNVFGYDEEDYEDEEYDEPISDDILETEYDGDGI